jgi:gliding motility-associated-like protein
VNIVTPNGPIVSNISTTAASCNPGNDGTITILATNGSAPYQYSNGGPNQSSNVITAVGQGNYTITVTDANGCSASSLTMIQNQPSPTIDSITVTEASCIPGCDGTSTIYASGGTNPTYTYSLNTIFQNSNLFNSLCVNTYVATVQDGNGCIDTMSFVISTANGPSITSTLVDSVNCNGGSDGSISVAVVGGTNPISYVLQPGNISNANGIFQNLSANAYTVTATDVNGCSVITNLDVYEPLPIQFDSVSGSGSSCSGSSNGTIFVSNIGGTGAFSYTINPSATFTPPGTFSNLQGNTNYAIVASDANGCSATTAVFVASPQAMSITNVSTTPVSCNGLIDGTAQISVVGGTLPYAFNMQPNNVSNANGNFTSLAGGGYTVTVTDANNCSVNTLVTITEPLTMQISNSTASDVTCANANDGSMQVTVTGGGAGMTYNLQPGNITNATGTFTNLNGNTYSVMATDANNCTLSTTLIVNEPVVLTIDSLLTLNVSCANANDGELSVFSSGGNGGNTFYLQPNNTNNLTGIFTSLSAQQYFVTVVDSKNCQAIDSTLITEPNPLTALRAKTNVSCHGGSNGTITISPSGGTPSYSYILSPGSVPSATGAYTGLTAGVYSVLVTDANNCTTVVNTLEITEPPMLSIDSFQVEDVVCYGDNSGKISIGASGGTPLLQYAITPLGGVQNNPGEFTDLYAGVYTVTVTDANSCTVSTVATLDQNPEIIFDSLFVTNPRCYADDNGVVEMFASGGMGEISYALNNGPATSKNRYLNLVAGNYIASAIDTLGCRKDSGIVLIQPDPVEISGIELKHLSCSDTKDGEAIVTASGGIGYYTYYVRPGIRWNRTGTFSELDKGFYTIKVVDSNQCEVDSFFTILKNPNPMFTTMTRKDLTCKGYGTEGEAEIEVLGGERPLTYLWNTAPPQQTPKVVDLRYGWYFVDVVDARGCRISDSVYVNPGDCCTDIFLPNAFSPNGDGNNDEFRVLTTAGVDLKQFEIYNRWGQRVWDTYTYFDGWTGDFAGEPAAAGTYYYVYRYRCLTDGKLYTKKGDIILVR